MNALFSIFGFLGVFLHGFDLIAQAVVLGSILFLLALAVPLSARLGSDGASLVAIVRRVIQWVAPFGILFILIVTGLNAAVLQSSLDAPWREVAASGFAVAGMARALAMLAVLLLVSWRPPEALPTRIGLALLALALLGAAVADSHAMSRLGDRTPMFVAGALHQAGAALWLGGLPCFALALGGVRGDEALALVGRRYSAMAIAGVLLILTGAVMLSVGYIGSLDGFYGTAYGSMAATKGALLGVLLLLGLGNFLAVRRFAGGTARFGRVRRFVVIECGIAVAVLMAAASITSLPPAVDLAAGDRASFGDVVERMKPVVPRLSSPDRSALGAAVAQVTLDSQFQLEAQGKQGKGYVAGASALPPRGAGHIGWSEYNHHWAGVIVLLIGLVAFVERTGRAPWARHWPLLFLLLAAFLFLRNDPEVWPMGKIGLIESLGDPEVVQHRFFVLLTIGFAFFEWGVRTGRFKNPKLALVFPFLTVVGATLLLAHSHLLSDVKEQLLIELTHLPMAVLGIVAGWARWLQVKAPNEEGRWAGWVWPVCFMLIGLLLLNYREA